MSENGKEELPICALRSVNPTLKEPNIKGEVLFDHDLLPSDHRIQSNKTGRGENATYKIEWRWTDDTDPTSAGADGLEQVGRGRATGTGEFVRDLKLGDVVTVWGKARFPAWQNHIKEVTLDVYWAV